jgi:DNA-binding NarL/FixJ family response regulator
MTTTTNRLPGTSWISEIVEAARRVFAFGSGSSAKPKRPRAAAKPARNHKKRAGSLDRRAAEVRKLAAAGLGRCEIARRTRLSQDTVDLLVTMTRTKAEVSAARGTFFRLLRPRAAV